MDLITGLSKVFDTVVDFGTKHPIASAVLLNAAASAVSPDELDMIREKDKLERQREKDDRDRRNKNLSVGGVDLKMKPSESKQFMANSGTATDPNDIIQGKGLIGRRM